MRTLLLLLLTAAAAFGIITPITPGTPISATGEYSYPPLRAGSNVVISLSGTFGSGTATLGYVNPLGTFTSFGRSLTAAGSITETLPEGVTAGQGVVAVSLAGATSPSITLTVTKTQEPLAVTSSAITSALGFSPLAGTVRVTFSNNTVQHFTPSADTDTARGLALEAAFAVATAGSTIDLSPGNYYVAKSPTTVGGIVTQFTLLDSMVLRLNGARLYHTATEATYTMFSAGNGASTSDWSILGPGIIEGTDSTPNDVAGSGENGINIAGNGGSPRRWRIADLTIRYFTNQGIVFNSTGYTGHGTSLNASLKISTGHITNCNLDYNNVGFLNASAAEFVQFSNCTANNCRTGYDIDAGNTRLSNCDAHASLQFGVRIRNSVNDGHGCWVGGSIVHNVVVGVGSEASMDSGFMFSGVTFGSDNNSSNRILALGGGLTFVGCYIESPIYASSTPTGMNMMANCFIAGTYTTVTDLSSAERLKWAFLDNYTLTGGWAQNDDQIYSFADNTAALAGGLTSGRRYRNSSTNAIAVVAP